MSLFKGNLDSSNKFQVNDDIRALHIIGVDSVPSQLVLETGESTPAKWYFWVDSSDNLRMNEGTAPTSATEGSAGSIVTGAANAGANRTLSNLGTVAFATDLLPGTTATYDLGSTTKYLAEVYSAKYLGHANATLTGATTGWTVAGKTTWGSDGGAGNADLVWYAHTATNFVTFDEDQECVTFEDETFLKFGTGRDISIDWDGTDLNIDSAADDYVIRFGESHDLDVVFESYAISGQDMGWIADLGTFQLCDDTILHIGGTTVLNANDGFTFVFDGTATLNIDAVTAEDSITIGETTSTDFELHGTLYNILWDASVDDLIYGDSVGVVWGAGADLRVESNGTLVNMTFGAVTNSLVLQAYAAQTTAALHIDGATNDWDGANDVGMLHLSQDTAHINAGATMFYVGNSGTPVAAAEGFLARFVDTGARTASTYAIQVDSTDNACVRMVTGSTQDSVLTIVGGTSGVGALVDINGASNTWKGANDVGMVDIYNGTTLGHAGATLLRVASTGTPVASAEGFLARFVDTGARTNATWAIQVDSTDNACMRMVTGSTQDEVLVIQTGTSSVASAVTINGASNTWAGADNTGLLHLYCADASFADAGATMLYVASSGQPVSAAEGFLARFVDTGTARTNAYAVEIEVTTTTGALHCNGHATFDRGLQCGAVAITAATAASPGVCPDGVSFFTVTSTNAAHVVQLPTPTPGTMVYLQGSTAGYELRSSAPATVAINGGTGASAESAIAAGKLVKAVCTTATTWIATQFSSTGDETVVQQAA